MLAIGAEIEGYRIERLLGRGGMGEVYEATQIELGRRVAFKVLHSNLVDDDGFRQRFRREGRLQAALEHPNVVTVYEAGEIQEGLFLAMRLIDGRTLKELIAARGIDPGRAIRLLAPVANALDVAHEDGLVHRDVKPQNILIGAGDHPFLADFGLTRSRGQTAYTQSGHIVGTTDYISPEQLRGEPAEAASDIYALSGVLYECLTGSVPYAMPTDAAVIYAHINREPPSARTVKPDLPPGIDVVIARGMAKESENRPASAGELIAAAAAEVGIDLPPAVPQVPAGRIGKAAGGTGRDRGGTTKAALPPRGGRRRPSSATRVQQRRRIIAPVLAVAGLATVAVVALLAGRSLGGEEAAELTTSVSGAAVSLRAPSSWSATAADELLAIPGLGLRDAIGAAPGASSGTGVTAGATGAEGAQLLPAELVDRVVGELPAARPVELGDLEALRYRGVDLHGFDREVTLYAAPSTGGVATVACYSLAGGADFEGACESIAQTLELTRGQPFPLAPSERTERGLVGSIARLDRERRSGRRQLLRAETAAAQATAAERLARAYDRADRRLGRLEVSPILAAGVNATRTAISALARDYGALAESARAGDVAGFGAVERSLRASEARLGRALSALEHDLRLEFDTQA